MGFRRLRGLAAWAVVAGAGCAGVRPGPPAPRVLNNLVTELRDVAPGGVDDAIYAFENPREGWVFFASTVGGDTGEAEAWLVDSPAPVRLTCHREGLPRVVEAFRVLSPGVHRVRVAARRGARVERLVVRAVPEILFANFESHAQVGAFPPYTWDWLHRTGVLTQVTTIIGNGSRDDPAHRAIWRARGRRWIEQAAVPGLHEPPPDAGQEYRFWKTRAGMSAPGFDGVIADEFVTSRRQHFPAWIEAIRRLGRDAASHGRAFYPYCAGRPEDLAPLAGAAAEFGWKFAYERYLPEEASEARARERLRESLADALRRMRSGLPDAPRHAIVVLSLFSAPPESTNREPGVSFKRHLDLQMEILANDPELAGLYGVMGYLSAYADEEYLRWFARLCRHYAIEGRRDPLSNDPYELPHLRNPDFAAGLDDWTVSPAEPGRIRAGTLAGLGWLQGRYPRSNHGDAHLWMKRSAAGPNGVAQEIRGLEAGRAYSVKLIAADAAAMTTEQQLVLSIRVEGADAIPGRAFSHVYPNCYSHWLNEDEAAARRRRWFTYRFTPFRARGASARLELSDWATPQIPGGPVDQELMINFIEVEPYFEE